MSHGKFALKAYDSKSSFLLLICVFFLNAVPLQARSTSSFDPSRRLLGGSLTTEVETSSMIDKAGAEDSIPQAGDILLVFSDLDGTLIHYPSKVPRNKRSNRLLKLPPSSTGMRGIISSKTLSQIQEIRRKGIKFILVSGARASTLLSRLPYLPKADAYCCEAGGRIFYPTDEVAEDSFKVIPEKYDGADEESLRPFSIVEDLDWRRKIEEKAGPFGSVTLKDLAINPGLQADINERNGLLWDFARSLAARGYVLDTKGYSACFRVNKKHQTTVSDDEFVSLLDGKIKPYVGLASSINLSCIDFYPEESGKRNW